MAQRVLYYATNRRHRGRDRWRPSSYGTDPSRDGSENLRFGRVIYELDQERINQHLMEDCGFGIGNGEALANYIDSQRREANIEAFEEDLSKAFPDEEQNRDLFGSTRMFGELREFMRENCDIAIFIHGFNVSWWDAVASALALELMLNRVHQPDQKEIKVVLFTWPSDGKAIPLWSYFSDRGDAEASGAAIGRGFLKVRDYLIKERHRARRENDELCNKDIHLICHSMGNFVLQNALRRTEEFSAGGKLPRLFGQICLCASDVGDDVFELGQPFHRLPEMANEVTIYHNKGDLAMPVSDYTKGNTDRLGWRGANRPAALDSRVHQVDCGPIVTGFIEHSYYLYGRVNDDIRRNLNDVPQDAPTPDRDREPIRNGWPNIWRMI